MGPRAIPAVFAALLDARGAAPGPKDPISARSSNREALFLALGAMPALELREHLEAVRARSPSNAERATAIELLAAWGSSQDLDLIIRLATPRLGESVDGAVLEQLTMRVAGLIARDASTAPALEREIPACEPEVSTALVRAVATTGSAEGLALLARLLDRYPKLELVILSHFSLMADRAAHPIDEPVLASVRRFVVQEHQGVLLEATLAAGKLEDFESIPALIRLLRDPSRGVRANALWALERMTGLKLKEDSARWEGWYEAEKQWWRSSSAAVFDDLRSGVATRIKTALAAVARQHLHRHTLARAVLPVLGSNQPSAVALACTTLRYLRSPTAVQALIPCLAHADPTVRQQAWITLKTITREDLPADLEAWQARFSAN